MLIIGCVARDINLHLAVRRSRAVNSSDSSNLLLATERFARFFNSFNFPLSKIVFLEVISWIVSWFKGLDVLLLPVSLSKITLVSSGL
jgi:uncharacterized membrane protein